MPTSPRRTSTAYAAAEAAWDDEEAYGEEEAAAGSEAPAPTRRRRRWLVVAIAAVSVAVLAIVAAVFLLPSRTSAEPFRSYANTGGVIPYTLSRPESWAPREGNASDAVLSPRPDAVGNTFLFGSTDRWSGTRGLLATSPSDAVGMYVFPTDTGSDTTPDALKGAISVLVPDGVTWASTHRQLTIGGSPADELEGVVQDPADPTGTPSGAVRRRAAAHRRVGADRLLRPAGPVRRPAGDVRPHPQRDEVQLTTGSPGTGEGASAASRHDVTSASRAWTSPGRGLCSRLGRRAAIFSSSAAS